MGILKRMTSRSKARHRPHAFDIYTVTTPAYKMVICKFVSRGFFFLNPSLLLSDNPIVYVANASVLLKRRRQVNTNNKISSSQAKSFLDTSAGSGKLCILGHLGLVFIWSCFVSCLLFLLFYVSLRNLCSGTCRKIQFFNLTQL